MKKQKIEIGDKTISVSLSNSSDDYISLTDIARYKNQNEPKDVIKNWLRSRSVI
jgi:hypothetical protein